MPTVLRLDGLRVVIYPNDHRPAQVHVIGAGCEAVFDLRCPAGPPTSGRTMASPSGRSVGSERRSKKATRRAARRCEDGPHAVACRYDRRRDRIVVGLSTGLEVAFAPRMAQGLESAAPAELAEIEISPSGFGLHFPKLDADLYLPALLHGFMGSRRWMAAQLGRQGGEARSAAKRAASRINGKLGGRPRKAATR